MWYFSVNAGTCFFYNVKLRFDTHKLGSALRGKNKFGHDRKVIFVQGFFFYPPPPPAMPKHLGSWVIWPMGHVLGHFLGHFLGQFSGSLFGTVFFVVFKLPKPYMPYMYCRHLKPQMRFCNCKYFKKIHTFFRSLLYT